MSFFPESFSEVVRTKSLDALAAHRVVGILQAVEVTGAINESQSSHTGVAEFGRERFGLDAESVLEVKRSEDHGDTTGNIVAQLWNPQHSDAWATCSTRIEHWQRQMDELTSVKRALPWAHAAI